MKTLLIGALSLVLAVAIAGAYFFPRVEALVGSAAGSTFSNAKSAGVAFNLAAPGANATSSSVLNSDASNRLVTGVRIACTGIGTSNTQIVGTGLASLQVSVATSSTSGPASLSPTNYVDQNWVIATSSTSNAFASSTNSSGIQGLSTIWKSGDYMTFFWNATNTALCTGSVDYLPA